jgi:hypothetical protein
MGSYKIQQGQVEGLRQAFAEMSQELALTGQEFEDDLDSLETSLTALLNATGNYLYDLIDSVDTTQTANLLLTGLALTNAMALLPSEADYDALQLEVDIHDAQIDLLSGRIVTNTANITALSGVSTGLVSQVSLLNAATGVLMPILGSHPTAYAGAFDHRINGTSQWSGNSSVDILADGGINLSALSSSDIAIYATDDLYVGSFGDMFFTGSASYLASSAQMVFKTDSFSVKDTGNIEHFSVYKTSDHYNASFASMYDFYVVASNNVDISASSSCTIGAGSKSLVVSSTKITLNGLPSSAAGLSAGDLWIDTDTIKIVP